jgi:hypothetical protein
MPSVSKTKVAWLLAMLISGMFAITVSRAAEILTPSGMALELDTKDASLTKIILLAGEPSSKPGQHEYFADCALMFDWLKQTSGVWPVFARTWPTNEAIFDGAKSIVMLMDGGTKHPLIEEARRKKLGTLAEQGIGVAVFHQSVDLPPEHADGAKAAIGGVWLADIGCRGHWDMDLKPRGEHPVLRGVKPFTAKGDGWLYNLHFADDSGFTPLLVGKVPDKSRTTADAKEHAGREEVIGWCYERKGGGRAFCFTGIDLHKNWELESQRRFVVNGILWSAGVEVPKEGAKVEMEPGDLEQHVRKAETPNLKSQNSNKNQTP